MDIIGFPLTAATHLQDSLPRSLEVGFPFSYVRESLLLAGDDSILYDPTGELRRVKTRLREQVSVAARNRVSVSEGYYNFFCAGRDEAAALWAKDDLAGAMDKAQWAGFALCILLRDQPRLKETRAAAERLGIPEFADRRDEQTALVACSDAAAEAVWAATQTLWDYTLQTAAEPIRERLRAQGIADPERWEITKGSDLFWPGERLNEFGRVMGEVPLALRWCRSELDRGKGALALYRLWACRGTSGVRYRWERLSDALTQMNHNCSDLIEPMLDGAEFARLGGRLDEAMQNAQPKPATPQTVQRAMTLTGEMERILLPFLPLLSREELAQAKDD